MARGGGSAGDARKALLQIMMSRKVISKKDAQEALDKICEELNVRGNKLDVKACLHDLNKDIQLSHLQIRGMIYKGQETYGIINMMSDDVAKAHASKMKDWERAFFKEVIKTLCEGDEEGIDRAELANLRVAMGGTAASIREKEAVIMALEAEFWLQKDKHNRYSLGPRTYMELSDIVRQHVESDNQLPQLLYV